MSLCIVACVSVDDDSDVSVNANGVDEGIEWDYTDKVLTIKANAYAVNPGVMRDYTQSSPAPWKSLIMDGSTLNIEYGVKNIGDYAFYLCTGFNGSLSMPDSVTSIGNSAFYFCSGFTGDLAISSNVTEIGVLAFAYCSGFTGNLTISGSIETIGVRAFYGCSGFTEALTIPNSVKVIGNYAFYGCTKFAALVIGDKVETIGNYAFYGCSGFTGTLTIPNSVKAIGNYAFDCCKGFSGLAIVNGVETIGNYAFNDCSGFAGSLTIPDSVTAIGACAFFNCSGFKESITIGVGVTSIGDGAFANCGGSGFVVRDGNESFAASDGMLLKKSSDTLLACPVGKSGTLNIPSTVKAISSYAFYYCSGFTEALTIPNSVKVIGNYAFYFCSGFTGALTIPNSVEAIGNYAFDYCTGCTSLSIGDKVKTIGSYAFYGCSGFTGLIIGNSVETICEDAFYGCKNFTGKLALPDSVTTIGDYAFYNCSGFTGLTIGDRVTDIGCRAFYGCSGFKESITIGVGVSFIGDSAFTGCGGSGFVVADGNENFAAVDGVLLNKSLDTILACPIGKTGTLTIPNSVKTISDYAFYGCNQITGSLNIPSSVTTIGEYAFNGCTGFNGTLTIPDSVTTIGKRAFNNCSGFTGSLTIPNNIIKINEGAFAGCSGFNGTLTIPDRVTKIDKYAFYGCSGFTGSLTIPNGVTSIGDGAFNNCSGFKTLTVPYGVTAIGSKAFYMCSGLTKITIVSTSFTIGTDAFTGIKFYEEGGTTQITNISSDTIGGYEFSGTSEKMVRGDKIRALIIEPNVDGYGTINGSSRIVINVVLGTPYEISGYTLTVMGTDYKAIPAEDTEQYSYSFADWSKSSGTVSETMTVTANFTRVTNQYVVTITGEGVTVKDGSAVITSGSLVDYGTILTVTIAEKEGHTGKITANGVEIPSGPYTLTGDVTLDGSYTVNKYTVTFKDGSTETEQIVAYGQKAARVTPEVPADRIFLGWYNGDALWDFDNDVVKCAVTLEAKWKENASGSVSVETDPDGKCELDLPADSNVTEVTIAKGSASIALSSDSVEKIKGKMLIVSMKQTSGENVYDVDVTLDGTAFSGSMMISLPYDRTVPGTPHVYWRHDGQDEEMDSIIDASAGLVEFDTTHNSTYVVKYVTTPASEDSGNVITCIFIGVLIILAVLGAAPDSTKH